MPLEGVEGWWGPQVAAWGAHLRTWRGPQWRQIKVGSAGVFEQGGGRAGDAAAAGAGGSKGGRVAAGKHYCLYDGSPADSAGSTECK